MKHILTIALCLAASTAFSQNKAAAVEAPVAVIVNDDRPVNEPQKVIPGINKPSPNPVTLSLQKSVNTQVVVAPVQPVDKTTELKAVAIDLNSQKGVTPVNRDRPKTSTLLAPKPVQELKPTAVVVKLVQ